jgi:hypothetical protein
MPPIEIRRNYQNSKIAVMKSAKIYNWRAGKQFLMKEMSRVCHGKNETNRRRNKI